MPGPQPARYDRDVAGGSADTRRLFLAVDLDEPCRASVAKLIERVRGRPGSGLDGRYGGRVKWVERENLHVTVRFLGATTEARWRELQAVLQEPLAVEPFDLRFDHVGTFPESGAPRVIWLGIAADAAKAPRHASEEIEQRLRAAGIPPDARPFHPHLTLGRFRAPARRWDSTALHEVGVEPLEPVHVDHVTLYESRLTPRGPRYEPLLRLAFGFTQGTSSRV